LRFAEVDNLWLRRGRERPLFVFAGHTDVVPSGPAGQWIGDPFKPQVRGDLLYGRGAADMKGSLAAMVTACKTFVQTHPDHKGSLALLITSDEEGPFINGTVRVIETLESRGEKIDWCIVGEPSSSHVVGDTIKNGRRGSLSGKLTAFGQHGHVAYPHLAENPVHRLSPALTELVTTHWDDGNHFFPPTTFQISNMRAGTGAGNVIPGEVEVHFNFRYSTEVSAAELKARVHGILRKHSLRYDIQWTLSGEPFLTPEGKLLTVTRETIKELTSLDTQLSTAGGTSDGRFIAPTGAQVIELGLVNATIHQINEHVRIEDLDTLSRLYTRVLERLLT
jgi:succinyl-diaminopimelate desuccinylase